MREIPICTVPLQHDPLSAEPDFHALGRPVDDLLNRAFPGKDVLLRALASSRHPDLTLDELIQVIRRLGHDRYDPDRPGDRYDNVEGREIDLFALPFRIMEDGEYMHSLLEPFYTYGLADRGVPERIDILIVYDADHLEEVPHRYEGREGETKRDGFVFRDPVRKPEAVLAILKIT